ncbi:hypothetical protein NM688_g3690 [Phlebia brevispora]|uniref:Uncharacterized protein n=1 Tax=Phlebia brevispora TaxID=194682 RepID=A0ACC1T4U3_9APHY|nr:hypothetical protein NM688_g3690 [Phlebia brevispora]
MSSLDSQETLRAVDPSPTPLSRHGSLTNHHERTRALPPLSIPPSLPTLPSESLLRRTTSALDRTDRKKFSTSSNITVRGESSTLPPVLKPPNTTTAVTTAPVFHDSPIESGSAISRTNSSGSAHTNGVTFSRPASISVSALSGLQQQHESKARHRILASNAVESPSPVSVRSPMSGSETERPRTIASRVRTSLDRSAMEDSTNHSRASTLTSTRRTRSRTVTSVTEIFAHAKD